MKRLLAIIGAIWFTLAGCHAPPSSTAPDSARADEVLQSHQREQEADIADATEAAALLNIPGTIAILNRIKGRLSEFTDTLARLLDAIESKSQALSAEIERMRDEQYAAFRRMAWVGGIVLAFGIAGMFNAFTVRFAPSVIILGGSLLGVGIAVQTIAPWVPVIAGIGALLFVVAIGYALWTNRRDIISIVKPAAIIRSQLDPSLESRVFGAKDSIANRMQSPTAKKMVDAALKASPVREIKKETP